MDWHPISTAPKDGTPAWLKVETRPDFGEILMAWSRRRKQWEGREFAVARAVRTFWKPDAPQPTHWRDTDTPSV